MCTGSLVWRRHVGFPSPSHHAIRATCTQLLPLVEMYCKYNLEEDCSNLRSLMLRFESVSELESHELGRNLLYMVRDDDDGIVSVPLPVPCIGAASPFDVVRERLASAALAIRGLRPQVNHPCLYGLGTSRSCLALIVVTTKKPFVTISKCVFELSFLTTHHDILSLTTEGMCLSLSNTRRL